GVNDVGMKFELIQQGKFTMGSPEKETGRWRDEKQHDVELTKDFYLGVHTVTQKQFATIMGYNPSYFSKDGKGGKDEVYEGDSKPGGGKEKVKDFDHTLDFPVENVSWREAREFCHLLNQRDKKTLGGWTYALPTEAQWEYACRGGAKVYKKYH